MIPLKQLVQAAIDSCFQELTENRNLLEALQNSRSRFLKLLVISRYPLTDLTKIHEFIDEQDLMIERIPNELFQLHFELKTNTLPNLDLHTAIDVLLTGTYRQLPLILNKMIPSVPTDQEEQEAYKTLEEMIQLKLYCDDHLPKELTNGMLIRNGLVEFLIPRQFCAHLTLLVGSNTWRIMKLEILVESDSLEYDGMPKIDDHQTGFIIEECQKKLDKGSLFYFYQRIKEFCLRYQLTLLAAQAQSLAQNRWKQVIRVQNDMDVLKITFWKDAFVLLVSRDSVIGALGLAEQRLSMQLNYLQSNKQLNFETGMLLERILEIQELDVEQLLFEATKMICSHIMSFWISNLASSPFQYVALHEASKTIVSTLEVCVADSNLQIIFNRRTGSITIHPTDSVGILTETFYIQALQDLELELNKHYDLLAVLKKVHLVKHLLYAETIALQVGLHKVLDPTSHFECIEEIRSIQASSDYMLFFKSDVMYGCVLCVSVRQNEDSLSLATEFRISLFSPFGMNKCISTAILPDAVFGVAKHDPPLGWYMVSAPLLQTIHRYCIQIYVYRSVIAYLQQEKIVYQYVIPPNTDPKALHLGKLCALNIPIVLQFPFSGMRRYGVKDNLFTVQSFPDTIFFQIMFDDSSAAPTENAKVIIKATVYLGPDLIQVFENTPESMYFLDTNTNSFQWSYGSFIDFEKDVLRDCKAVLRIIHACRFLYHDQDLKRVGTVSCLVTHLNQYQFYMNWNERGDVHQHFYWSVVFNPRLIVSDPFLIWTNACNSELEKGSKLENILKHLLLLYPIASGIGLLKNRYRIVHGVDISIKIKSLFEFSVTFNDKMGIDIGLFNSLITFKDFKMDHLNDENVLELPKYLDAEKEGIIGNCNRMLSTCFAFADRIMCSVENIHGFSRLIYNLIDMLVSLQNMNIFLKTCTQKQMLQWDANAFMSVTGNIKIGFQGSLHSSWKPQCILQGAKNSNSLIPASFTKVANFIFQRVQELPFATKCSFTWLKLMHQYSQLPEFLIIDFSNCLQVKPEEVKHSYFEMLLLMPDVPGIDPEVCKPGDCCFLIDPQNTILRSIFEFKEGSQSFLLPVAYNWKTGVICKWEKDDISTLDQGSALQERLSVYQSSSNVIQKSFALCSKSDGKKLKPEQKLQKTLRHFTGFPLATLQ